MDEFPTLVAKELTRARELHRPVHSLHEGYSIIMEEVDELKAWVWRKSQERRRGEVLKELVHVAATVQRLAEDVVMIDTSSV